MDDANVALALSHAWTASRIHDEFEGTTYCIEGTKVGLAVLRGFGVRAHPLPCAIVVANQFAAKLSDNGVPVDQWPRQAWAVGVDPDAHPPGTGWNGHLIIRGDDWLCDLSGEQFARPNLIAITAWCSRVVDPCFELGTRHRMSNGGTRVDVYPRPELARWRVGSAWRLPAPDRWVAKLSNLVRRSL